MDFARRSHAPDCSISAGILQSGACDRPHFLTDFFHTQLLRRGVASELCTEKASEAGRTLRMHCGTAETRVSAVPQCIRSMRPACEIHPQAFKFRVQSQSRVARLKAPASRPVACSGSQCFGRNTAIRWVQAPSIQPLDFPSTS